MYPATDARCTLRRDSGAGFSLPELMIATAILLIISSIVASGILQTTMSQRTIANRTEMHSGVRSATELLQQEVGQAGRVALPGTATLGAAVPAGPATQTVRVNINGAASVSGIFIGEQLAIDSGPAAETVTVTNVDTTSNQKITAVFVNAHNSGATINALGGFGTGIVPPSPGILYRNVMAFDLPAASKPALTGSQVLLGNILVNPNNTACFTYMPTPLPVVNGNTYVLDVAITLTVQTQLKDPTTNQFQTETKALLNVSPRNVFDVWQLASAGGVLVNRLQPMPPTVLALLP